MTAECALTKLSYLLSKFKNNPQEVRRLLAKNLRGELTSMHAMSHSQNHTSPHVNFHHSAFITALAQALSVQSHSERMRLERALMPHLVCAAAGSTAPDALDRLKEASSAPETVLNAVDFDGRTPLHIACCVGSYGVVEHLLLMGASVHVRDRLQWTPLVWACRNRHAAIAALLVRAGALLDLQHDEAAYLDFLR
jgi:lysophospholipase